MREPARDPGRDSELDGTRKTDSRRSPESPKAGDAAPVRDALRESARECERVWLRLGGRVDELSVRRCVRDGGRIVALSLRWCDRDGGRDVDTPKPARLVVDDVNRDDCDRAWGGARTERDSAGASGDGIPGRWGRDRADFRSWPNVDRSNGDAGSLRRGAPWPLATGVSSLSDTNTQFVGENSPSGPLSPAKVVVVVDLASCDTRLWVAVEFRLADVADVGNRLLPPIVDPGVETLRFDTRVFSRSSVALMRAWRSCRSLKPFVFAARLVPLLMLLTARAVPGEGW